MHHDPNWQVQEQHVIETERTYLRHFTPDDVDNVMQIFTDPEAMKYSPADAVQGRAEAKSFIQWNLDNYETHGFGAWAVISKSTGKYIGQSGIIPQEIGCEVFYSFVREFWGKGIATEVASACKNHALTQLNQSRLIAIIHPQNNGAIKVATKLGMHDAGIIEFWGRKNSLFEFLRMQTPSSER
jgi:RimJ/RimL family protein N-acetyltransferase